MLNRKKIEMKALESATKLEKYPKKSKTRK